MFLLKAPSKLTEISLSVSRLTASLFSSLLVASISLIVIFGWMFNADFLKRIIPGYVVMNPVTAVLLFILSVALCLLHSDAARQIFAGKIIAAFAAAIGLIKVCALIGLFDIGIDRIFFNGEFLDKVTGQPNRMAPVTAFNLVLLGVALLLFRIKARRRIFYAAQYRQCWCS